jgi:ferredoxin-NADP reductase
MAAYTVALRERGEVAERTLGLSFDKPVTFTFKAGQFLDMTVLNPPETDAEGNRRSLSIASAPHEAQLLLATRLRQSAFKRVLNTMVVGTEVKVEGPYGNLVLHGDASDSQCSWLAGLGSHRSAAWFFAPPRTS